MTIVLFMLAGICMGLTSGLFGIGGGVFAVPLLLFVLQQSGYTQAPIVQTAVITSLAVAAFTTLISAHSHWQYHKDAMLRHIKTLAPGLIIGSGLGALTLVNLAGDLVKLLIGILVLLIAHSFLSPSSRNFTRVFKQVPLRIGGVIVGALSATFGIAGGLLTVPLLRGHGLDIKRSVAVASGSGSIVASCAVGTSALLALMAGNAPLYYIHSFAFFSLVILGGICARLSSRYARKLAQEKLKKIFAVFLIGMGVYMIADFFIKMFAS